MKKLFCVLAAVLSLFSVSASAEENWTPHLPGLAEGLASGALPPEGVYFANSTMYASAKIYDKDGNRTHTHADIFVDVPIVMWVPGVKLWGADYGVVLAQPFDYLNTIVDNTPMSYDMSSWGMFNTYVAPVQLSWKLPEDFHVMAGFGFYAPTGHFEKPPYVGGHFGGIANSIGFWTLEPVLGVSWLRDGWNLSANFTYGINFENPDTHYTSGNVFQGDYTATKRIGEWTVGVGGYSVNQLNDDKSKIASKQTQIDSENGNRATKYAAGPLVGYDFGPFSLTGYLNYGFGAKNTCSSATYWTRLVLPLGKLGL
jgi:hypothetical protein